MGEMGLHPFHAERGDAGRGIGKREQRAGYPVDRGIGGLRGQGNRDQQLERRGVFQFGFRLGFARLPAPEVPGSTRR